jgi:asparagine synthase (glutamine-hydrolysing)
MCGITGIFNHGNNSEVTETSLRMMTDAMSHRGPDDAGIYVSPDRSVGLGHRRLSIIDLSSAGHQPMSDETGKIWITFNGEIYNFLELRTDLEKDGVVFRSKSDTEVLIQLYKKLGQDMLPRLRGMFAFCILDVHRRSLFLARDRIGIKPLYYSNCGGRFIFGSEIKALLATGEVRRQVSVEALYHYLSFLTTPAPQTLFEGIHKLPAGYRMTVDSGGQIRTDQWWTPFSATNAHVDEDTCISDVRHLLKESIRYRMISDVPFGVFLSGGIDSSTNVALMAELMDRPVETFSIAFKDEATYDELPYARKIADRFHTNHHEIKIGLQDLLNFLPQLIYHQDEPIADPVCIPVYYVSRLAKDHGVTVCQVGEGSDELFCGYPHWSYVLGLKKVETAYRLFPSSLRKMAAFFAKQLEDPSSGRLEYIRRASYDEPLFWGGAEAFYETHKRRLLSSEITKSLNGTSSANVIGAYFREFLRQTPQKDPLSWMTFIDLKLRLPELLLMRVDKMTMATSLEARVPFLDHKLVEYVMGLSMNRKIPKLEPKYLLKKAVRGVIPDEIIDRRKQGFGVPVAEWFQQELGKTIRSKISEFTTRHHYFNKAEIERLLSRPAGALPWYLFNFVLWHEAWIEGTAGVRCGAQELPA